MTQYIVRGDPGDHCKTCLSETHPVVRLRSVLDGGVDMPICVLCLARWIDAVTGWSMASNVLQALAVGNAGERFHHPERNLKPHKKQSGRQHKTGRYRRVYLDGDLIQSEGGTTAGED